MVNTKKYFPEMGEYFYTVLILMIFSKQCNTKTFTIREILTEKRNIEKKELPPLDKRLQFGIIREIF